MDNQTKIIMGLLVLILVLVAIFGLKVAGVIKPAEKSEVAQEQLTNKLENGITEQDKQESNLYKEEFIIEENNYYETSTKSDFDMFEIIEEYIYFANKYAVVVAVITMILNIGIAMMYRKIGMPMWTIILQIVSPILSLLNMHRYITLTISIFEFISAIMLLKLLDAFSIELGERKNIVIGASAVILTIILIVSKFNIIGTALTMVSLFVAALILMFHIKMSLNLAESFDKGIGFKIGLILLPGVFQAILGYQRS